MAHWAWCDSARHCLNKGAGSNIVASSRLGEDTLRPIDAHVHVGSWSVPEFGGHGGGLREADQVYRRWNWGGALLFPTDSGASEPLLEEVSGLRSPVTYRVGWWADFRLAGNLERFRERKGEFAALKLHPSVLKVPATDDRLRDYLDVAEREGMPVVVHCGRWREVAGFEQALEGARRHPGCPWILAHMGGDSPHLVLDTVDALAREVGLSHVHLGTESVREPWLLERAIERLGAGRLVFGSDYNLNHPEVFRRLIEVLDVTDDDREMIFRRNVNGLLREAHRFF